MTSRFGLGKGLGALIPEGAPPDARIPSTDVPIDRVVPNPWQPRSVMDEERLQELTDSIREHGVIQPLLVTQETGPDGQPTYQLIAGERRWRAARLAGLERVPVTIRQSTPQELLELAIIENVQRADLSPLEEAAAYVRLMDEFHLTQAEVATRVGRSRSAVANLVRLAELPPEMRTSLAAGEMSEGHARALLMVSDPDARRALWRRVVDEGLNVRRTERMVREALAPARKAEPVIALTGAAADHERAALEQTLQRSLGTKVSLRQTKKGGGSLTIHFYSNEELEGVLDRLGVTEI